MPNLPVRVPLESPLLDEQGNLSRVWNAFFRSIASGDVPVAVEAVNGANGAIFIGTSTDLIVSGPTAPFSISGFTDGANGRRLTLLNYSGQTMTIKNLDAGASAGDRILTLTGANVVVVGKALIRFTYYNIEPVSDADPPGVWVFGG